MPQRGRPTASDTNAKLAADFAAVVNMTADELESWLRTTQSRAVGWGIVALRIAKEIPMRNKTEYLKSL